MEKETFIHFRENGSVRITGGLVFCRGHAVYADAQNPSAPKHECVGNRFFSTLPRWWQLRRWARLLRELKDHTTPK